MNDTKLPEITPDQVARMVMFTYGKMVDARPFWAFLAVKPSRYNEMERLAAGKAFDINNFEKDGFGEVVVSGEGLLPPNSVIKQVSQIFNTPIRDFFKPFDANEVIAKEIEKVKKELGVE